jgi:hypothetical protein
MRLIPLTRPALAGACALALACGDGPDPASAPTSGTGPAGGGQAEAQSPFGLGSAKAGHPCRGAPHRQFDFWVGQWEVQSGNPTLSASFVTSEADGCAIMEDWHGAGGGRGRSLNAYDASDHRWHQHWVENSGFYPLRLDGGFRKGKMVMQESYPDPKGTPTVFTDRYSWTALGPDDVSQFFQQSTDGGATFGLNVDFRYHRRANPAVPVARVYPFCTDPSLSLFQEFDFTVGSWQVKLHDASDAELAGRTSSSEISKDLDGCLYEEKLRGPDGYEARVFTNIRPIDEIWRRTYVDSRGLRVYLTGPRIKDGRIVLTGSMPKAGGGTQQVRAIIHQVRADRFVERWQVRSGSEWKPLATATYTRR